MGSEASQCIPVITTTIVVFQHLLLPMTPEAVRNLIEAEPQATAEAETAALLTGRKLWEEPRFSPCVTRVHPQGFFQNLPFWSFSFENHSRLKILFLAFLSEIRFLNLTLITTERLLQSKSMFFVQISIYRQLAFYWLNLIVRIMSVEVPHMVQDLMPLDGLPLNHLLCWVLLWICVGIQTERVEDFNFTTQVCQSC